MTTLCTSFTQLGSAFARAGAQLDAFNTALARFDAELEAEEIDAPSLSEQRRLRRVEKGRKSTDKPGHPRQGARPGAGER